MLALARAGRAADALAAYREGWRLAVDELGVEPPPRLRDLHARILAGAPDTRPAAAPAEAADPPTVRLGTEAPRQLPAPPPDFVGRVAERAGAAGGADRHCPAGPTGPAGATGPGAPADATGPGGPAGATGPAGPTRPGGPAGPAVVVVGGMGGVGKTSLVAEVCGRLRDRFPDGQLFISLRGTGDAPVAAATAAGRCLESLGLPPAAVPPDLESRAALLRDLLADRRVLIVADDAAGEGPAAGAAAGRRGQRAGGDQPPAAGRAAGDRAGRAGRVRPGRRAGPAGRRGRGRAGRGRAGRRRAPGGALRRPPARGPHRGRPAGPHPDGTVAELADRLAVDGQRLDWLQLGDLGVGPACRPGSPRCRSSASCCCPGWPRCGRRRRPAGSPPRCSTPSSARPSGRWRRCSTLTW